MLLPTSPEFAATVTASHQVITRCDLWYDGALLAGDLHMVSGEITIEDDDLIRSRLVCEIADPYTRIAPGPEVTETAGVYGHELHVRTGIMLPGGREELISAGW